MTGRAYNNYGRDQFNIENVQGDVIFRQPQDERVGIPHNLPKTHVKTFVGRAAELTYIHSQLRSDSPNSIVTIEGMGGMGKSELALQYALAQLENETYSGGICLLRSRKSDVGSQIVSFARTRLGLTIPDTLQQLEEQVGYCWSHWKAGEVLLVLDDVTDYQQVRSYLPSDGRFKVLITTRLQLGKAFQPLMLQVLQPDAALDLLRSLVGTDRIDGELEHARNLCKWLGYLPLGLELVGRYLEGKSDLALVEMQKRLEAKRLDAIALKKPADGMTAQLGVESAFELSWQELTLDAQSVCYLLSLFALAPIGWGLVEACLPDWGTEELEEVRDSQLVRLSLLQRVGNERYLLHQLIWEFFRAKADDWVKQAGVDQFNELKRSICQVMAAISRKIPEWVTLPYVGRLSDVMPHLEASGQTLAEFYADKDLYWAFEGVARFYEGQAMYSQAEPWCVACVKATQQRLGGDHPDVATGLNDLAELYYFQGHYEKAERFYLKSLAIRQKQLGEIHPQVAQSLNNLAGLYYFQRHYGKAEPLFLKALKIRQQHLGQDHPDVATSFNNLALLYRSQGRYREAEPLFLKALKIRQRHLGQDHPQVAQSLHNVALIYQSQGNYKEAERIFLKSLAIRQQQLGEIHPQVAQSLDGLADLYRSQERYGEAETTLLKALSITERSLGENHPTTILYKENLQSLQHEMNHYPLDRTD